MRRSLILLGLVLLVACGGTTAATTATLNTTDPNAVHTAWVSALRNGQRAAATAAAAPQDLQQTFVDETMTRTQAIIRDQRAGTFTYGALQRVDIQPVSVTGQQATGVSVWHFAQRTVCYQTDLVQTQGRWGAMQWHQRPACS